MSEDKKKRNSYADVGLMIAITVLIVEVIKSLLFEIEWDAIWIVLAIAYCAVSYKYDSESKTIKNCTTAFLCLSALVFASIIVFDRNVQPKMHAFEGAKKDSIAEEEFIQKKEPELTTLIEDTTEVVDTLALEQEEEITSGEETEEGEYVQEEPTDETSNSNT